MAARRGSVISPGGRRSRGLTAAGIGRTIQTDFSLLVSAEENKVDRVVIVGASLAGLRAAQAARTAGVDGGVGVVGDEVHRPYTRPPLSKELLAGEHDAERVLLPSDAFDAQWRLGVPATRLDRARRRVVLADGDELPYDRVILATGSRARRWPGPGGELEGVHVLRGLDDALALQAALERRPRVAVV